MISQVQRFKSVIPYWLLLWQTAALLSSLSNSSAATIGPDAGGYVATDAVTFAFENITNTGTRVLAHADVSATNANLGFTFTFYGKPFTNLYFGHNGLISFGGANTRFSPVNLTTNEVNPDLPTIAVLWDDWITTNAAADAVYYQTLGSPGNRRFVVQWNNIYRWRSSPSGVTFEATLFEASGEILFQYLDVISGDLSNNGARSTVGIRDTAGQTNGRNLQWSYYGQPRGITNFQAIRFSAGPGVTTQPASTTARCGTNVMLTVVASGAAPLSYQWRFNATPINGATTSSLTLSSVNCAHSGTYSVLVSNSVGSIISSNAVVTVTNAGGASLTCPDDIVVQFFDETVPSPDPNLLLVSNLCPPVFKNWLGDSAPQANGCTNIIFRSYEVSNACGVRLICTQRIHLLIPPVVLQPFPASVTQTFQPDGVHMTVCAAVQGTGPFNYSWSTNGDFAFTTDTSCATFVFSPIEENLRVSVRVGNNCGGGSDGGTVTTPCSVCLSRGAPNVLSSTTGSDTLPSLPTQPPNCSVGATARWFKMIATNDTGLITISTEGSATDTVLAVYTGPITFPASLTHIACNDNISSSNLQSRVSFQATMGTVYWLVVDPHTTSTGLRLTYGFEPKIASFSFSSNRVFQLTSSIAPAIRYRVEAAGIFSTNSSNWTTVLVTNLTTTYPYVFFRETNAPSIHRRFYRLAPTY